jgi:pyruvate/2-oxoglutarate dehydrogenase complex dihydrolipoamide dehydrogenase (E3) component
LGCIHEDLAVSAEALNTRARRVISHRIAGDINYSLAKIRERKDKVVFAGRASEAVEDGVTSLKAVLLIRPMCALCKGRHDHGRQIDKVIIATGSRPAKITGFLDSESVITSDDAVLLKKIPWSLTLAPAIA